MDQIREMRTFLRVAKTRNFSSAARQLGVSRSTVTKLIAGLEQRLGVILLVRSTHHVTVTNAGEVFAEEAQEILDRIDHLHQRVGDEHSELRGEIRIGAPASFASMHLVRAIEAFREQYGQVRFLLIADDGNLNVVKEGLDLSIRIAPGLPDIALISQVLVKVPQVLVASPHYLDKYGRPERPDQLSEHACLVHTIKSPDTRWMIDDDLAVSVQGPLRSNLGEVLRQAAIQGNGLALHPTYMVAADLQEGRLERVLPDHRMEDLSIHAVYADKRFRPRRVTTFLQFLKAWVRRVPDWGVA